LNLCEPDNRTTTKLVPRMDRLGYLESNGDDEGAERMQATGRRLDAGAATCGRLGGTLVDGAAGGGVWLCGRVWFRFGLGLTRGDLTSFFSIQI
jgi:hypothetical protein